MKLETVIKPRRDGTVKVRLDGEEYVFTQEGDESVLMGDVVRDDHIAHLLNTGNFAPAEFGDFSVAAKIAHGEQADGQEDTGVGESEEEKPTPPIEAGTPPNPAKPAKRGGRRHKGGGV